MTDTRRLPSFNRPLLLRILGVLALAAALLWAAWISRELSEPRQQIVTVRLAETIAAFVDAEARGAQDPEASQARVLAFLQKIAARLDETRLGIALHKGPEGPIPDGCFYTGTSHPRGLDSRYADIGFVCRGQILGSGRAIL